MTEEIVATEPLSGREHFEAVVCRYQGPLLRYVRCSLGPDAAQDVVQEVFLRLHKTIRKNGLRNVEGIRSWLFTVAHNCTTDVLRKRQRDGKLMETVTNNAADDAAATPDGLEEVVHREDCRLVLALLDKLPPKERQVLQLKIHHEMSYREISEITNQALGTVGYLVNHGLGRLARELKAAGAI